MTPPERAFIPTTISTQGFGWLGASCGQAGKESRWEAIVERDWKCLVTISGFPPG